VRTLVFFLLASTAFSAELSEEERQKLATLRWPGQVNEIESKIKIGEGHQNWMRIPNWQSMEAMKHFASTPAGQQTLRDLAACYQTSDRPGQFSDSEWRKLRQFLFLLAADGGNDNELVWTALVVLLNPDGPCGLGDDYRHPAIEILGKKTALVILRTRDGSRETTKATDASIITHAHEPVDATDVKLYGARVEKTFRRLGVKK